MTWPLVVSSSNHDLAAMDGAGTVCALAEIITRLAAKAANSFFMETFVIVKGEAVVERKAMPGGTASREENDYRGL